MFDHFDWLAPLYDRVFGPPDAARWQALLRLPSAGRLLDAGGGTGRVSAQLRPLVDGLILSDLSRQMLKQAQGKGGLRPLQAKVETLPFPEASFERVMVVDALHHFGRQPAAIRELLRVLKPGGRLVIEEPDITTRAVKLVAWAEKLMLMGSHFHSPAEIEAMIAAHGVPARIEHDGRWAAWIVADK
jgi:ubiquinone/menaquinone biosynthesis C-methylase UbiE